MSTPETIGDIKLRLGEVVEPGENSDSSVSPPGLSPPAEKAPPPPTKDRRSSKSQTPKRRKGEQSKKKRVSKSRMPKRRKGEQSKKKRVSKPARAKDSLKLSKVIDRPTPEALTSNLTDQLVRIDRARFTKRRILITSTIAIGFITALVIVLWIVFVLLIPKITEMTG